MSKFVVKKRLSLAFLGDGWQEAYMVLKLNGLKKQLDNPTASEDEIKADPKRFMTPLIESVERNFVEGMGYDGEGLVPLEASDIWELPVEVFSEASKLINGAVDPKL